MVIAAGHARDASEAVGVDGVHADGYAVQARVFQRLGQVGEQVAVGGQGDVERFASSGAEPGKVADEIDDARAAAAAHRPSGESS